MTNKIKEIKELRVTLVIYPHVLATSVTLPIEMLLAGEAFARRYDKSLQKITYSIIK
jgi:hypothetical protein